ncbi:hypothetical protein ARHIZOSPH14_26980 [Agromyces rhizosphaerae]|uniref:Uncharacterized protein n=1 Tax=Agromyces rhizosphaerae TaxID=88374 RepID=A0A9W6FQD0_9MICO|nr:hypothetical protein ARHIZOSPH14_26980 [Agromyces rhizosphaerae]
MTYETPECDDTVASGWSSAIVLTRARVDRCYQQGAARPRRDGAASWASPGTTKGRRMRCGAASDGPSRKERAGYSVGSSLRVTVTVVAWPSRT